MQSVIQNIVSDPATHACWLNTLSMMENAGARKIKNCEHPIFVNEIILKHSAEEARHAYYLKKQIAKIAPGSCPTYEAKYILSPKTSCYYLHMLDISISRYLKSDFSFSSDKLRYAAYLLVTYAIEVRADELYPQYQEVLTATASPVTVKSIIAEEKNHLHEMTIQLQAFSPDWEKMVRVAVDMEEALFQRWKSDLEKVFSDDVFATRK